MGHNNIQTRSERAKEARKADDKYARKHGNHWEMDNQSSCAVMIVVGAGTIAGLLYAIHIALPIV